MAAEQNSAAQAAGTPKPSHAPHYRNKKRRVAFVLSWVGAALFVGALIFCVLFPWPATVTVNGSQVHSTIKTSIDDLVAQGVATPERGDLVAIDGSVLAEGAGHAYEATVNGEPLEDVGRLLAGGDEIVIADGDDVMEEYAEEVVTVPAPVVFDGTGAVHLYQGVGEDGWVRTRTGATSGLVLQDSQAPTADEVVQQLNIDTGEDKVIALTFDDGPWKESTAQILDILAENDAKATFFTVGERITGLEELVQREREEGHQVCTHSWDHAAGSGNGVNLSFMTPDEQYSEIERGLDAISKATGEPASTIIRTPGGNFPEATASILSPLITAEIGWNIDTRDWTRPGAEVIFERLLMAEPGDIILMHDGGGDRSQTVQALHDALPLLKEQGFRFVTIDELLSYA